MDGAAEAARGGGLAVSCISGSPAAGRDRSACRSSCRWLRQSAIGRHAIAVRDGLDGLALRDRDRRCRHSSPIAAAAAAPSTGAATEPRYPPADARRLRRRLMDGAGCVRLLILRLRRQRPALDVVRHAAPAPSRSASALRLRARTDWRTAARSDWCRRCSRPSPARARRTRPDGTPKASGRARQRTHRDKLTRTQQDSKRELTPAE